MSESSDSTADDIASLVDASPALKEALARLGDLEATPLAEHHDRLAEAHEALHAALDEPRRDVG